MYPFILHTVIFCLHVLLAVTIFIKVSSKKFDDTVECINENKCEWLTFMHLLFCSAWLDSTMLV